MDGACFNYCVVGLLLTFLLFVILCKLLFHLFFHKETTLMSFDLFGLNTTNLTYYYKAFI